MALVIVALSPTGDVSALRNNLTGAGLSLGPLQIIGPDDSTSSLAGGIAGADILTSDGGMGVPGLTGGAHRLRAFFRNETLADRLGDLEIPDSEVDNYVEALERGKYVVAYFAKGENIDAVTNAFGSSNLINVRKY